MAKQNNNFRFGGSYETNIKIYQYPGAYAHGAGRGAFSRSRQPKGAQRYDRSGYRLPHLVSGQQQPGPDQLPGPERLLPSYGHSSTITGKQGQHQRAEFPTRVLLFLGVRTCWRLLPSRHHLKRVVYRSPGGRVRRQRG